MKKTVLSAATRMISLAAAASLLLTGCGDKEAASDVITETAESGIVNASRYIVDPDDITYASSYNFDKLTFDGLEEMDFSCVVEAENSEENGGVVRKTDKAGYSGEGYVDISDNNGFRLTVDIPASQYYKLTVRHCAGSHKENPLVFNGLKALDIISESGDWQVTEVDGVFLEKGENIITLGAGWSWFSLDSIAIEDGSSISDDIYANIDETLCNPYANLKTQNIYQYLKAVYGKRTLAGQCTDYGNNTETDALFLGTGKYPAVRTFDFIYDSMNFCHGEPKAEDVDLAIQWSNDGGLVVFDWHWYSPCNGCSFYSKDTSFKLEDAVSELDLSMTGAEELETLYIEDKISIETYKLIKDIDNISALMQRMEDAGVTVMWRPLHEANGGWFWWGASGADAYKWLWKLMYHRMTDLHELDNLIWVWNAQGADWYPGDEYCDIASMDIYNGAYDYGTSPSVLADMTTWSESGKLVTMSECATMPDPDLIVRDNAYWLWFAVWNWDYIVVNGTTQLSDAYTSFDMMEKVYNSDVIITRDELPVF